MLKPVVDISSLTQVPRHVAARPVSRLRKISILAVVGIFTFVATAGATGYVNLQGNLSGNDVEHLLAEERPERVENEDPEDPLSGKHLNLLLIGIDARYDADGNIVGGTRSDATIIAHISADRTRIDMVSIPRDSMVQIPACSRSDGTTSEPWFTKFNAAFQQGSTNGSLSDGAACTIRTVEAETGVYVDGWAVIDFAGFEAIVDALGGVDFYVDEYIYTSYADLELEAGQHHFDGATAKKYMQARKGVGLGDGSDIGRLDRQQELLKALLKEARDKNVISDLPTLYSFLNTATQYIHLSSNLASIPELAGLALSMQNLDIDGIETMTVPWGDYGDGVNVAWTADAERVWEALRNDEELPTFEDESGWDVDPGADGESDELGQDDLGQDEYSEGAY